MCCCVTVTRSVCCCVTVTRSLYCCVTVTRSVYYCVTVTRSVYYCVTVTMSRCCCVSVTRSRCCCVTVTMSRCCCVTVTRSVYYCVTVTMSRCCCVSVTRSRCCVTVTRSVCCLTVTRSVCCLTVTRSVCCLTVTRSVCCCPTVTRSVCYCLTVTRSGCCCLTVTRFGCCCVTLTRSGCCYVTVTRFGCCCVTVTRSGCCCVTVTRSGWCSVHHHPLVPANHWMICDDLLHPVCEFSKRPPSFPPSQVHIVMWERQSYHGNPVAAEAATHCPMGTTAVATNDGLAHITTQTTTVPPGVSTGLPPGVTVIVTPALMAASDISQQPGTWMAVSPVGFVAPVGTYQSSTTPQTQAVTVARNSRVVHSDARTKTGKTGPLTERLQRCREKFERAKAIRPRVVAPQTPPTVICVRNLQCGQSYAVSRPALPSAQCAVSQSAVTPRPNHCDGQLSLGVQASSSHKSRGTPTVASGNVRPGMGVTRSVPVFAGYTAKAHGCKRDVGDAKCSGEINNGVNTSSSLNSGVNTSSSANTGANTSTTSLNSGVNTSCSANTDASTLTSVNGGVSMLTSVKSRVPRTNTAVSKKRVIRQSGGSDKRRRLSTPPVLSTHNTKCVTSSAPETCHSTQEKECVVKQVDTTDDIPDKFDDIPRLV